MLNYLIEFPKLLYPIKYSASTTTAKDAKDIIKLLYPIKYSASTTTQKSPLPLERLLYPIKYRAFLCNVS